MVLFCVCGPRSPAARCAGPSAALTEPGEQCGGRLVRRVLRHEPALERGFQDRLAGPSLWTL